MNLSADGVLGFDGVPDRLAGDLNLGDARTDG